MNVFLRFRKLNSPYGKIVVGASLISFTSVFVKFSHVPPTVSAFYRMFFSGMVLFIIAYQQNGSIFARLKTLRILFIGALVFSLDLFFWHRSILIIGPGLATLLGNCQVFFVAIIAVVFMKERLSWQRMVSIPIAMIGLFFLFGIGWNQESGRFKLGVLLGLLTAVSYAIYILVLRHSQGGRGKLPVFLNMAYISLFASFLLGITILAEGTSFVIPDAQSWSSLLGMAILGQVIGWVLISKELPNIDASAAGVTLLIQPVLAFIWDILFFGHATGVIEIVGMSISLAAIYLGSTRRIKRNKEKVESS